MARSRNHSPQPAAPQAAVAFLEKVLPFSTLPRQQIERLARHCLVGFFPKGSRIVTAGEEVSFLHLIQKGGAKAMIVDDAGETTLKDYRGEGATIGALPIIGNSPANMTVETVEDTFCILIPRKTFEDLLAAQPEFAHFYLKALSDKLIRTAYNELRRHKVGRRADDDLYLFTIQVGDIVKQEPKKAPATISIQAAARRMAEHRISSLLIHDPADGERIIGIITDRDLRNKVIAAGVDYTEPVTRIMSTSLTTVLSQAVCFDALIRMMSAGIHHLLVEREGRIIGVLTSHDIMLLQGSSPYYLFKEINKQPRIQNLYPLAGKTVDVVRHLLKEGARAGNITRMISIINDEIVKRLLTLLEEELGPPPLPYCWLLLGSEGRREQTFRTDQDNAIVYADPPDERTARRAAEYFTAFAEAAIGHLVACGYPLCPGGIMASNPTWRQPLAVWKQYFDRWIMTPDAEQILHATIFFDFRPGHGALALADELRAHLLSRIGRQEIFLLHLARECLAGKAPLSFFRNFIVEKDGAYRNRLDIKQRGIAPFVNFARVMALKHGVKETNTLARLRILAEEGQISSELATQAQHAYEFQMYLRIVHQLQQIDSGAEPDNHIDPSQLSDLEKRTLKDAFSTIERLQEALRAIFPPT